MTEYVIDQGSIEDLVKRFSNFSGAVIQNTRFSFGKEMYDKSVTIMLHTYDSTADANVLQKHVKVTFAMANVWEFKIDYAKEHHLKEIAKLQIIMVDDFIYLDFSGSGANTPEAIRKSRLYSVCRGCVVKVEPLDR